jgi:membrane protease YdiL (CAAX protease family)
MRSLLTRRPIEAFFVLAFALSWLAVLPVLLNPGLPPEPFEMLGALMGPTLSAFVVLGATEGWSGLRLFLRRYIQWREGFLWWMVVLFGALISVTLVATILAGPALLTGFFSHLGPVLVTYSVALVAGVILGPLWEEPGWRGFALPRLQEKQGPLLGTILLGSLWAAWHIPGYFGGWLSGSPVALLLSSIGFSVLMTWVFNHSHGSILLMILMHASSNATLALGSMVLPADLPAATQSFIQQGWIPAITYSVAAVAVVLATRGRLSYGKP